MSKVHCIFVIVKLTAESKCIVMTRLLLLNTILVVADVFPCTLPSLPRPLSLCVRIHKWLHAMIVKTVWLDEINDVEPVGSSHLRIL
jgi:hypothetical protein